MNNTPNNKTWEFIGQDGTFRLQNPHLINHLYFPLANEARMLSVVTPTLNGDIKTDHNAFFSQPLSIEDLHNTRSARNFWVYGEGLVPWSLTGNSVRQMANRFREEAEQVSLKAGLLWHTVTRTNDNMGLKAEITNFVPAGEEQVELMRLTLTNTGTQTRSLTPTAAIPIFGRSADNLRDHRHVTSLLHTITCSRNGVCVKPTLSFDERGHIPNTTTYAVLGVDDKARNPEGFFPIVEDFIGEGGSLDWPCAIVERTSPTTGVGGSLAGYEALGGLRFPSVTLSPGQQWSWYLVIAVLQDEGAIDALMAKYGSPRAFEENLARTQKTWSAKLDKLRIKTGDSQFDGWMRWVSCQPILRRIFGNSFLPYHDYGRGGRGWRDLWQDILSLLLMTPTGVDEKLLGNFAGVRMDGSNATIIGNQPGEFKADRNEIPRVWMDHGAWPLLTVKLYIDHTGDLEFLLRQQTYFKDHLTHRAECVDKAWKSSDGTQLKTSEGEVYYGSVLEHMLVQHLTAFFNVGEHNIIKLEDGDWNDGLDLAPDKGESVAFTALYASNLRQLAELVLGLKSIGVDALHLASELALLLDTLRDPVDYANPSQKRQRLESYFTRVERNVTGERLAFSADELAADLRAKAQHLTEHLRAKEWIHDQDGHAWFNGYYDNDGQRLEGPHPQGTRMTLTGQVFPLMGAIATEEQAQEIVKAVDHYLYDPSVGGYRLNTDFGEVLMNLGRAFGFAYGHKENGAMFSHMAVMYAFALYQNGLVKEGFKVLDSIYRQSVDFSTSRIYPGIPEYFNDRGRGMYPYLTGSASWYLLTLVTEVFGVRGVLGDLVLMPKLRLEQFDTDGKATLRTLFAGQRLKVAYSNPEKLDASEYGVEDVLVDGQKITYTKADGGVKISRSELMQLPRDTAHCVDVVLGKEENNVDTMDK